jgi:hypothetical protein
MVKHKKIFSEFYGVSEHDIILCIMPECRKVAVDIHHVDQKKMGGHAGKDRIENLAQVCRCCHNLADAYKIDKEYLFKLVEEQMKNGLQQ